MQHEERVWLKAEVEVVEWTNTGGYEGFGSEPMVMPPGDYTWENEDDTMLWIGDNGPVYVIYDWKDNENVVRYTHDPAQELMFVELRQALELFLEDDDGICDCKADQYGRAILAKARKL